MAALSPKRALVFIGFMGAGKSAAAGAVAEALDEPWADTDEEFVRMHGTIHDAFTGERGEAGFRDAEREIVLRLLAEGPRVLALGGGAVETPEVRDALAGHVIVWCRIGLDEAARRIADDASDDRPLTDDPREFRARFERRRPLYSELATALLPEGDRELPARAAGALAALRELPGVRMAWAASASGEYPAFVGPGLLGSGFWPLEGERFLITDSGVEGLYADRLEPLAGRAVVEPGEGAKTLAEAERVLRELTALGMTRADHIAALGGGVVGDLAGFCAATYQRGVPVVQVPTTLVAQVDSAYGGKTGVDLPEAKNYVGAYHLPAAVLADTSTLQTLPAAELSAGYAEVLKTALLAGGSLWERVRSGGSLVTGGIDEDVVFACARTKLEVVAADERDSGLRASLNLGHTVGHAIEAASDYSRYRHGEAVGLGLLAALRLSGADELRDEVRALLAANGLPVDLDRAVAVDDVLVALERDKKRASDGVRFVLLERPGDPLVGRAVDPDRVRATIEELVSAA